MSSLKSLRDCSSLHDLAHLIGFKPKNLAYIAYGIPEPSRYHVFEVPKKSGGVRVICAPTAKLQHVQSRLAQLLQNCLIEIDQASKAKPTCRLAHGFKKGHSIYTNASMHRDKCWVLNLDLKDFFPSINFGRVRGYFIRNRNFELQPKVATLIAQLCCFNNSLPQGAPSSPVLSNLIASQLDVRMHRLAKAARCTYTRYADDLTFSTNLKKFPDNIAEKSQDSDLWLLSDQLRYQVHACGFAINPIKTRMQYYWSRQDVTGLTVNESVNVSAVYARRVRAACHHLITGKVPFRSGADEVVPLESRQLLGMSSFITSIKGSEVQFKRYKVQREAPCAIRTHQLLLDYLAFCDPHRPTIICEGQTDNIYLGCALRALEASYAKLFGGYVGTGLPVRLFRYSRTTDFVQRLAGGTGDLKDLIFSFRERTKRFSTFKHPTIIVVDNDSGSKGKNGVFAAASSVGNLGLVDGSHAWYKILPNLYLVPTPLKPGAKDSMIEDFFDPALLGTKLGGKTFNPSEASFDPKSNYGKVIFSKNVILKNSKTIDFSGFKPLLDSITSAIDDFY